MQNIFAKELLKFKSLSDASLYSKFQKRLNRPFLKHEDKNDHVCVFFLPVDKSLNYCYLGWHKKADGWIPPGGHINKGERPQDTVKREFSEELDFLLTKEKIIPFALTVKEIKNPNHICRRHWDLWYLVVVEKQNFNFLEKEYYQAGWLPIVGAEKVVIGVNYRKTLAKLKNFVKTLS